MMRGLWLAGLLLALEGSALAEGRVVFVVAGDSSPAVSTAIARTRNRLAALGYDASSDREVREALEGDPPARAPVDLASARDAFSAAREAYAQFDYPSVLDHLARLDRAMGPAPPTAEGGRRLLADRFLLAGMVHSDQGQRRRAELAFRAVAALAPDLVELDPGLYRPQIVEDYRHALETDSPRTIEMTSEPAGAAIWIDGVDRGTTPLSMPLSAGQHHVALAAPGFESQSLILDASKGKPLKVALRPVTTQAQLADQRARLSQQGSDPRRVAGWIAGATGAEFVILIRNSGDSPAGAVYRADRRSLGPWMRTSSPALLAGLDDVDTSAPVVAGRAEVHESPAWYQKWWGKTLLVGGGVAVAGAVGWALFGRGQDDANVDIGPWCFEGRGECAR